MNKKIFIITGESSGDIHAANLVRALKKESLDLDFRAWGGDHLAEENVTILKNIKELAFMGFLEVVQNLSTILKNFSLCKKQIKKYKPDVLVLVDYPGFNLRMAKWAEKQNIPVCYYIAPQAWAWKKSRVQIMKKVIDQLLVILPFENTFFSSYNIETTYVGHPLLDELNRKGVDKLHLNHKVETNTLALLPGSRKQELKKMLPTMLLAATKLGYQNILLAKANTIDKKFIESFITTDVSIKMVGIHDALRNADFALVSSGTATLETALYGVPQIVCYKGSQLSYEIAKRIISLKYISLVNLILDHPVVPELIQGDLTVENIVNNHNNIASDISILNEHYQNLWDILDQSSASANAAKKLLKMI